MTVMVDIQCKVFTGSIEMCNNLTLCDLEKTISQKSVRNVPAVLCIGQLNFA